MRARILKAAVGAAAIATAVAVPAVATSTPTTVTTSQSDLLGLFTPSLKVIGLLDHGTELSQFSENNVRAQNKLGSIRGLSNDRKLIGIDYRVQNGKLYGVGSRGGIYVVRPFAQGGPQATKVGQLTVALRGSYFAVDFNPAANRLRVVSNTGQNLRHNIDDPAAPFTTTVDVSLTYPPLTDTARGVTAVAYTNNDLDTDTSTTLFVIDTLLDQVAIQSPANNGTLAATGKLGITVTPSAGFDIYSTVRSGTTVELEGYATLYRGGSYSFYEVDLLTGDVDKVGTFAHHVSDIAIPLNQR